MHSHKCEFQISILLFEFGLWVTLLGRLVRTPFVHWVQLLSRRFWDVFSGRFSVARQVCAHDVVFTLGPIVHNMNMGWAYALDVRCRSIGTLIFLLSSVLYAYADTSEAQQ